jgi:hypothetical protein
MSHAQSESPSSKKVLTQFLDNSTAKADWHRPTRDTGQWVASQPVPASSMLGGR